MFSAGQRLAGAILFVFFIGTRPRRMTQNHFAAETCGSCLAAKPATSGLARFSFAGAWYSFVVAWANDSESKSSAMAALFNAPSAPTAAAGR
jgi:hypothetical protein